MFIVIVLLSAVLFIVMDLVWFNLVGGFLKGEIESIARVKPDGSWDVRLIPAIMVYLIMGLAMAVFVQPKANSILNAALFGGLLGLVGYGIYDLTNLATLKSWTVKFALVDIAWGIFLCATVSTIVYLVIRGLN